MLFLKDFFYDQLRVCVFFFIHIVIFPHVYELETTHIEISRSLVNVSARELGYLTMSCIFG